MRRKCELGKGYSILTSKDALVLLFLEVDKVFCQKLQDSF